MTPRLQAASLHDARRSAEAALDEVASSLILVDEFGRPTLVNRPARRILRAHEALWVNGGLLHGATPAATARLRALVKRTAYRAAGIKPEDGGILSLPCLSGAPCLTVLALPLAAIRRRGARPQSAVILLLRDPSQEPLPSGRRLEALYGLTAAEGRLAALLATGESLQAAATALKVSRETVRSQLKAIFGKTATRRQSELLRKLALDSALLPESRTPDQD